MPPSGLDCQSANGLICRVEGCCATNALSTVAAAAANEAQHLSGWSLILDRGPIPLSAIPKPLAPAAARKALAPLLASVQGGQLTG